MTIVLCNPLRPVRSSQVLEQELSVDDVDIFWPLPDSVWRYWVAVFQIQSTSSLKEENRDSIIVPSWGYIFTFKAQNDNIAPPARKYSPFHYCKRIFHWDPHDWCVSENFPAVEESKHCWWDCVAICAFPFARYRPLLLILIEKKREEP